MVLLHTGSTDTGFAPLLRWSLRQEFGRKLQRRLVTPTGTRNVSSPQIQAGIGLTTKWAFKWINFECFLGVHE